MVQKSCDASAILSFREEERGGEAQEKLTDRVSICEDEREEDDDEDEGDLEELIFINEEEQEERDIKLAEGEDA